MEFIRCGSFCLRNFCASNDEQIHETIHGSCLQARAIGAERQDRVCLARRDASAQVSFEFAEQRRYTLLAPATVADRVFDSDLLGLRSILKKDLNAVADRTLRRIQVIDGKLFTLDDLHLVSKQVDARVASDRVLVVFGGQAAENERHRDHILDAMIPVSRVVERAGLFDDPFAAFLCFDHYAVDLCEPLGDFRLEQNRSLNGRLGMELGRERDLK